MINPKQEKKRVLWHQKLGSGIWFEKSRKEIMFEHRNQERN